MNRNKVPKGAEIFESKRPVEAKSNASDVASTASCNKKPTWLPPNNSKGSTARKQCLWLMQWKMMMFILTQQTCIKSTGNAHTLGC